MQSCPSPVLKVAVGCAICLGPVAAQTGQPIRRGPTADGSATFDAMWRAVHGQAAPLHTLVRRGTCVFYIDRPDQEEVVRSKGRFEERFAEGGKARVWAEFESLGRFEEGSDGTLVWELDPLTGPYIRNRETAADHARTYRRMLGPPWRELYAGVTLLGTRSVLGRTGVELVATPQTGNPESWVLDPETMLPFLWRSRIVNANGLEQMVKLELNDWREVQGVRHAFAQRWKLGQVIVEYTLETVVANATQAPEAFALPAAVAKELTSQVRIVTRGPIQLLTTNEQRTVYIRVRLKREELWSLGVIWSEVKKHLQKQGITPANPPYTRFHRIDEGGYDVEAGFPVGADVAVEGKIQKGTLPATRVAMMWHYGPYETLPKSYAKLDKWLAEKKVARVGASWEVYWNDPVVQHDMKKLRTQIYVPICEGDK